jgi:TonB family protein
MRFCLDDGAALVDQLDPTSARSAADATLFLPGSLEQQPPTVRITEPAAAVRSTIVSPQTPALPVMSGTTNTGEPRKGGALLWLLGALIISVAAVAVAFIVTRNRGQDTNAANQTATGSPTPATNEPVVASGPSTATTKELGTNTPSPISKPASEKELSTKEVPIKQPETVPAKNDQPAPAPPSSEKSVPSVVSGGVLNGKATYLAKPSYPAAARAIKASGPVTVQVTLDEQGNVISASAVSGHPLLRAAAVSAARASKFSPTKLSGQPVKVTGVITYNFVAE